MREDLNYGEMKGKTPSAPPPTIPPYPSDAAEAVKKTKAFRELGRAKGHSGSILTSGLGDPNYDRGSRRSILGG